ncbi:ribonuclease Z [Clostridium folliculivorans]|uniref:Ribonuclease Z n=1 Tax=Clostridium folliculivorans TaxID=2886038 RepID=A0A9W6D958_9CLOT|nr:ribonuclease Z [Clostridium folliculivorans]GKU23789.1 ribonuclease Z [Clostridium folliculivorans]GKU29905.1 ribonuclease Z [Clostridium folliculivorans]
MLDVAFLGCGGTMPMPERFLASMLLKYNGRKILVDCGEGTQVSMRRLGWGFKSIDIICITHFHGDHILGLPGLLATISNSGREEPIYIIGPEGLYEVMNGLKVVIPYLAFEIFIIENPKGSILVDFEKDKAVLFENYINTLAEGKQELKAQLEISTSELDHSSPCIGYSFYIRRSPKFAVEKAIKNQVPKVLWSKLQKNEVQDFEGKTYTPSMVLAEERKGLKISYITDTRPIESIREFVEGSDLLVCEGTYGADEDIEKAMKNKHMTFRESATIAKEANVDELIITHYSPAMMNPGEYIENAANVFKNTSLAYDGAVKTINFKEN